MYLIVGGEEDALAREVCRQATSARLCSEADLLNGHLADIARDCLSGVIVRPQRWRLPLADSTPHEQNAGYHDNIATLCSFLMNLACPVVNQVGLSWWARDISYPRQLRIELAGMLGLAAAPPEEKTSYFGRLWPSARNARSETRSVYVCGGLVRRVSADAADIEDFLMRNTGQLRAWQRSTGVYLCRLDFEANTAAHLRYVEPFPSFDHESEPLVREIAAAALEVST